MMQHVLQVAVWEQTEEEVEESVQKMNVPSSYTEDFNVDIASKLFHNYVDRTKCLLDSKLVSSVPL
jgi:hypothetical protein